MYEDLKEYLNWYDTRTDMRFAKDAPTIGLVLQRSHLVTGDDGHYAGVVSNLEARGAKVGALMRGSMAPALHQPLHGTVPGSRSPRRLTGDRQ